MHLFQKIKIIYVAILICFLSIFNLHAINSNAKQAILIDANTGKVLFKKNADQLMPPSSMTKILTTIMVFRELSKGSLKEDDLLPVSKLAWKKGGSRMFLEVGTMVRVQDLIKGITVQSGNDASIVLAEGLYGNEAIFATEMTNMAHKLGATKTTFKNSTGWPDPSHLTTARDLSIITMALLNKYKNKYDKYFGIKEFTYNNIRQQNRNPLLYKTDIKADGVKTGHTSAGGYGMVGSAVSDDGTRLIVVVNGLKTQGERARAAHALLLWGFRNYTSPKIFEKGETVLNANVWLGNEPTVPLIVDEDLSITVKRELVKDIKVLVKYQEPININKIKANDVVGHIEINLPDSEIISAPLIMSKNIKKANFFKRIFAALHYIIFGHNS